MKGLLEQFNSGRFASLEGAFEFSDRVEMFEAQNSLHTSSDSALERMQYPQRELRLFRVRGIFFSRLYSPDGADLLLRLLSFISFVRTS